MFSSTRSGRTRSPPKGSGSVSARRGPSQSVASSSTRFSPDQSQARSFSKSARQRRSSVVIKTRKSPETKSEHYTVFRTHASLLRKQRFCRHMFLVFKFIGSLLVRCLPGRLTIPEREWLFEHFTKAGELKEPAQVARLLSVMGITAGTEEVGQVMHDVCFYKEGSLMDFRQFMLLAKFFKSRFEEFKKVPASLVAFVALGGNWEADAEGEHGNVQAEALEKTVEEFQLTTDVQKFIQLVDDSGDGELQYSEFRSFIDDGAAIRAEQEEKRRKEKEEAEKYDQYGRRRKRKKVYRKKAAPPRPEIEKEWDPFALLADPEALLIVDDGTSDWASGADDDDDEEEKKSGDNTLANTAGNATNNSGENQAAGAAGDDDKMMRDENNNNNDSDHDQQDDITNKVKIVDPDVLSVGESVNESETQSHYAAAGASRRGGPNSTVISASSTRRARGNSKKGRNYRHGSNDDIDDDCLTPGIIFNGVQEWIGQHRDVDRRIEERDRTRKYREETLSPSVLHGRAAQHRIHNASMLSAANEDHYGFSSSTYNESTNFFSGSQSNGMFNNSNDHHYMSSHPATPRVTKYERPWERHQPYPPPSTAQTARRHPPVQTSSLSETAFGTAPRFKGDTPLAPLQKPRGHTSSGSRGGSRRRHFRDGPATVNSVKQHISKVSGAAARGNNNSNAADSRPTTSQQQGGGGSSSNSGRNSVSAGSGAGGGGPKWFERDPFAPPPGSAGASPRNRQNGEGSSSTARLPEIHRQRTGRTMIVQPDFVF